MRPIVLIIKIVLPFTLWLLVEREVYFIHRSYLNTIFACLHHKSRCILSAIHKFPMHCVIPLYCSLWTSKLCSLNMIKMQNAFYSEIIDSGIYINFIPLLPRQFYHSFSPRLISPTSSANIRWIIRQIIRQIIPRIIPRIIRPALTRIILQIIPGIVSRVAGSIVARTIRGMKEKQKKIRGTTR